jgi:hypothetical protein
VHLDLNEIAIILGIELTFMRKIRTICTLITSNGQFPDGSGKPQIQE